MKLGVSLKDQLAEIEQSLAALLLPDASLTDAATELHIDRLMKQRKELLEEIGNGQRK